MPVHSSGHRTTHPRAPTVPNTVVSLADTAEKQTHAALLSQGKAKVWSEQMNKESTGCNQCSEGMKQGDEGEDSWGGAAW